MSENVGDKSQLTTKGGHLIPPNAPNIWKPHEKQDHSIDIRGNREGRAPFEAMNNPFLFDTGL
jgi:hypothetical protein